MTRSDQINLYRKRAAEMEMLAAETKFPSMRASYLHLADEWGLLADSLQRQALAAGMRLPERARQHH
jgi:hypothetical protein